MVALHSIMKPVVLIVCFYCSGRKKGAGLMMCSSLISFENLVTNYVKKNKETTQIQIFGSKWD